MAQYRINDTTLTNIADAIRNKTGELTRIEQVPMDAPAVYDVVVPVGGRLEDIITDRPTVHNVSWVDINFTFDYANALFHLSDNIGVHNGNTQVGSNVQLSNGKNQNKSFVISASNPTTNIYFTSSAPSKEYGVKIEISYYDANDNLITTQEAEVLNTMTPEQMADEINGLEVIKIPEEAFAITGDCGYKFSNNGWNWFIDMFGDKITTYGITNMANMFYNSKNLTTIPFEINGNGSAKSMFEQCQKLQKIPQINGEITNFSYMFHYCSEVVEIPNLVCENTASRPADYIFAGCTKLTNLPYIYNLYPDSIGYLFRDCYCLRSIPEDYMDTWNFDRIHTYTYTSNTGVFNGCYSLRNIPSKILSKFHNDGSTSSYYKFYSDMFMYCYALDEIVGLPVDKATLTMNTFGNAFKQCDRLKTMLFETNEDGTPKTAKWKGQTVDLSLAGYLVNSYDKTSLLSYNSGITADKEVSDEATYQALKDDPDWFASTSFCSRYDHNSAVATINSLPDTSAYGTNIIKFKAQAGQWAGGAINTLTEEEIAVAAAKGWTVSLVS